jgi:hypothetical protein
MEFDDRDDQRERAHLAETLDREAMPLRRIRSGWWLWRTSMVSPSRMDSTEPENAIAVAVIDVSAKTPKASKTMLNAFTLNLCPLRA